MTIATYRDIHYIPLRVLTKIYQYQKLILCMCKYMCVYVNTNIHTHTHAPHIHNTKIT